LFGFQIVETMSLTDSVADFMGSINELSSINVEDLELVAPEIIRDAKSRPTVPEETNENIPKVAISSSSSGKSKLNGYAQHNGDILTNGHRHDNLTNGHNGFDSDDEFYDSVEVKFVKTKINCPNETNKIHRFSLLTGQK
jgi:hypothetical protein